MYDEEKCRMTLFFRIIYIFSKERECMTKKRKDVNNPILHFWSKELMPAGGLRPLCLLFAEGFASVARVLVLFKGFSLESVSG